MPMKVRYTTINGEVIAENRGGVRKQYVPDPLGSTVALLDSTATVTDTFRYWPYGEVASRTGTTPTPFQFVGTRGYISEDYGYTYVRTRYLNSSLGRWMSNDAPGPWSLGAVYADCNPATLADPSGLDPDRCNCMIKKITQQRPVSPTGACVQCGGKNCNKMPKGSSGGIPGAIKSIISTTGADNTDLCQSLVEKQGTIVGIIGGSGGDIPSNYYCNCVDSCTATLGGVNPPGNYSPCDKLRGFAACLKQNANAPSTWQDWVGTVANIIVSVY